MSVVFLATSVRHVVARPDADARLGWTRCGQRFAWAVSARRITHATDCRECAA